MLYIEFWDDFTNSVKIWDQVTRIGNDINFSGLVWFVWFYGILTFVGYLTPKQFSLA